MRYVIHRFGIRLFGVVLSLVTFAPSAARAWCQSANVQPPMGSCEQRCPMEVDAGDERFVRLSWDERELTWVLQRDGAQDLAREDVVAIVRRSFERWTHVTCEDHALDFEVDFDPTPDDEPIAVHTLVGPNENQVLFDDSQWVARDHDPAAFALTTAWFVPRTGEILGADLELNEESWQFAECPDEGCDDGRIDLENTVVHELGHFFGLAHTPDDHDATMWACAAEGEVLKRDLAADDLEGMCAMYGSRVTAGCGCSAPGASRGETVWLVLGVVMGASVLAFRRGRRRR